MWLSTRVDAPSLLSVCRMLGFQPWLTELKGDLAGSGLSGSERHGVISGNKPHRGVARSRHNGFIPKSELHSPWFQLA